MPNEMTDQEDPGRFGLLASLGYNPIPIMPRQKAPGEFSAGRWRAMDGWTRYKTTAPTKFELGMWDNWPDANIGIVLGSPVGDGLVVIAIDLDLKDPEELASVMAHMPPTPMSKRGAKGETLFYRASPDLRSRAYKRPTGELDPKTGRAITEGLADFLTGNATKQTVVPPSRHPDGFDYMWLRGPVAARDLPIFGPNAFARFEDALRRIGWDAAATNAAPPGIKRATPTAAKPASAPTGDETVFSELNAAALANLSAWVPELGLFNCRSARGGFEAVATWRSSSTGRPDADRKRNLSIQPGGIKDFGTEQTYSPIDLVMVANSVSFGDAYEWLRMLIEPEDETGVVVNFEAMKDRIEKEQQAKAAAFVTEIDSPSGGTANSPAVAGQPVEVFFERDIDLREWSDGDCTPDGLVGEISKWITSTAIEPSPLLAYGAALATVGTLASRVFKGPTGTGTHLYVIGAAPTGVGKDHPLQCVSMAMNEIGMPDLVGPGDFTAEAAVYRHLQEHPVSVCLIDEFGSFWKRISRHNAGAYEKAITRALREPWGRSFGSVKTKQYALAGPASEAIWWPAMSILGMTTPIEFFGALTGADVENGMVNRLLVLPTQRRAIDVRTDEEAMDAYFSASRRTLSTPASISEGMKAVRYWKGEVMGTQLSCPYSTRPTIEPIAAEIADDARRLLFSYRKWVLDRAVSNPAFSKFYSRAAEMAQRVALIHAIGESALSRKGPYLTYDSTRQAIRLVDWSLRNLWERVANHQSPNGFREVVEAVYHALERRGGKQVPNEQLRQSLHGAAKRDLRDAIEELEESKTIAIEHLKLSGSSKPSACYTILRRPSWAA
jgi:hypothetical protein